jgi:hypothetical protein
VGNPEYRSNPRPCELCGQLVVSVCDSLDMGDAVTCHYEPATEDEKAKRIAELEAELAALRDVNKRLNNDANLLMESNAQLTEENAALREDAAVGAAIREFVEQPTDAWEEVNLIIQVVKSGASFSWQAEIDNKVCLFVTNNISGTDFPKQHISVHGDTLAAALVAAGLMENTDGTD